VVAFADVAQAWGEAFDASTEWNDDDFALGLLLDVEVAA
jgi:hypothetical protein